MYLLVAVVGASVVGRMLRRSAEFTSAPLSHDGVVAMADRRFGDSGPHNGPDAA